MSSIQKVSVEVLLAVFQATDPAGTEALQLTSRRFNSIIAKNTNALPTRLACDLIYHSDYQLRLHRAPASAHDDGEGEVIARGEPSPKGLQDMYQKYGRKTAIRKVSVWAAQWSDALLAQVIQHFPSVTAATCLDISYVFGVPADAILSRFDRLEMIVMIRSFYDDDPFFWNDLFDSETFRRVPKVHIMNGRGQSPEVDDGETFDFVTDFSLLSVDQQRVVSFGRLDDDALDAIEHRFNEHINSIGGQVCAVATDNDYEKHVFTNMTFGGQKETLAKQFMRDAFGALPY